MKYDTIKQSGYIYLGYDPIYHYHLLKDPTNGKVEAWVANKNHASYGIIYKNTHLEFAHSVSKKEL